MILGLAHPHILGLYQVSLAAEGRRLSVLLENCGEHERARSILELLAQHAPNDRSIQQDLSSMARRFGEVDELIERCLLRADEEVAADNPMEAIAWLQEILLHDQTRRDVARMIRDLRFAEVEKTQLKQRRNRLAGVLMAVSAVISLLFVREWRIFEQYGALPALASSTADTPRAHELNERLAGLDQLLAKNQLWLGMFSVTRERRDLQREADKLANSASERNLRLEKIAYQRQAMAESARLKGLDAVTQVRLGDALFQFERSLDLGALDWDRRSRISANIVAIEELLEQRK